MKTFDIHESDTTAVIEHLLDFGVTKVIDDIEDGYLDFNDEKIFKTHEDHLDEVIDLKRQIYFKELSALEEDAA